jgi:hypothetical protein
MGVNAVDSLVAAAVGLAVVVDVVVVDAVVDVVDDVVVDAIGVVFHVPGDVVGVYHRGPVAVEV